MYLICMCGYEWVCLAIGTRNWNENWKRRRKRKIVSMYVAAANIREVKKFQHLFNFTLQLVWTVSIIYYRKQLRPELVEHKSFEPVSFYKKKWKSKNVAIFLSEANKVNLSVSVLFYSLKLLHFPQKTTETNQSLIREKKN